MPEDSFESINSKSLHAADPEAVVAADHLPKTSPVSTSVAVRLLAADIKIAHSIFALPFALLACFLARDDNETWGFFAAKLSLVIGCMIAARTAAMLANRILDRKIDAANPRTENRALASGKVALRDALLLLLGAALAFGALCGIFGFAFDNWWPIILAIPVLAWICAYPWFKRFTWCCHLYLGISLAISPLAAALAIAPATLLTTPALWYLSGMVLTWVAGFDVIYALQDLDIDRQANLQSIPARFGSAGALWISRSLHLLSMAALLAATASDPRLQSNWFGAAVAAVILLLVFEHLITARHGTGKIQITFFLLNGIISCILGAAGILSVLTATT